LPVALSRTAKGRQVPFACAASRWSMKLAIWSGAGMEVYHSFQSSPSRTASARSEVWLRVSGARQARELFSRTGSSQAIRVLSYRVKMQEDRRHYHGMWPAGGASWYRAVVGTGMAAGGAGGGGAPQRGLDRAYRLRAGAVALGHRSSRKLTVFAVSPTASTRRRSGPNSGAIGWGWTWCRSGQSPNCLTRHASRMAFAATLPQSVNNECCSLNSSAASGRSFQHLTHRK